MQPLIIQILDEVRGTWRFRWVALAAAWAFGLIGWAYVFTMPDVYEASARVYVDSQTALGPLLHGLALDPNVESELSIVQKALLSRPQLEAVARKTDLDLRAKTPEQMDLLLKSLQARIGVVNDLRGGRPGTDGLYRITFQDHSRQKTLEVVETLLNTFVEQTLGNKRTGQESAQRFLDDEIADLEQRLTESEQRLAEFKKKNVGTMPGEGGDYFARLQTEMGGEQNVRQQLALADARRAELNRQLSGEDPVLVFDGGQTPAVGAETGDITARIHELEKKLEEMLLRYTDKHPEVIAVRDTISQLKKRQEEEIARVQAGKPATGTMSGSIKANPVYQGIQAELNRTEVQAAELRQDLAQRSARVAELKRLVDTVPEVEAELARLNRDYEITRTRYRELVERRETAKLSESAERQGAVKFQIIDPPTVGFQPVAPARMMLLIGVLVAALAGGAALAYALNQTRPVYQNPRLLGMKTGLPVLGVVSRTLAENQRLMARKATFAFSAGVSLLAIVCIVFVIWSDVGVRLAQRMFSVA
ncbi:MAG TPA: XrtA system polysaccharide chain length determinant [Steroidobacteraceae bacterium]|jgi:polysaccharide chain length determinant protein (PEP-CTERM system associated)